MDRASWPPTFHIKGLELDQVPSGTWETGQLIPFHVQDLRERENAREGTHADNNSYPASGQASSGHHTTSLSPDSPVRKTPTVTIPSER